MKFKSMTTLLATFASMFIWAQEQPFTIPTNTNPGKICILVTDVGTIDTVAKTEEFLAKHIDFALESFTLPLPIGASKGHLTLWPQRYGTDGFYICRMRRK